MKKRSSADFKSTLVSFHYFSPVIERFCLPPDAKVIHKDATKTEVDAEIFRDLIGQGHMALTVFCDDGEIYRQA